MTLRKSRSKKLAALDAEIEATMQKAIATINKTNADVRQYLENQRLKSEAARLAGEPDYAGLTIEDALAVAKARSKAANAYTESERRAAKVEELSLLRVPVRKIAKQLGLSYGYVVQLRRKLGLSKARPRK
ncbi:hypothetical protein [Novosphingobium sp.]|uniref:hypothetical protein n=1 Tax=Novosphingobium sp. TaxID=1874826 RepID=UPI003562F879